MPFHWWFSGFFSEGWTHEEGEERKGDNWAVNAHLGSGGGKGSGLIRTGDDECRATRSKGGRKSIRYLLPWR